MSETRGQQPDRQLRLIQELLDENVYIAGDVAEIDTHTWAIHGVIPVGGDVIVAEFDTYDEARVVLDTISTHGGSPILESRERTNDESSVPTAELASPAPLEGQEQ
jgi:hypothetical protein